MLRELKRSHASAQGRRRAKRRRLAAALTILTLTLLLLTVTVALIYIWYMGNHTVVKVSSNQTTLQSAPKAPPIAADNSTVGVAVSTFSSPVAAGSNVSLTIRTKQKAACTIVLMYGSDMAYDSGLVPKNADEYGVVNWSWKVESTRAAGTYPVDVICARDGMSGYRWADLVATKS